MNEKKHQRELQRRLGTRDARRVREEMIAELSDPARYAQHLAAFGRLALTLPALRPCRFPPEAFVDALLDLAPPADAADPVGALRAALLPRFADLELAQRCRGAIREALRASEEPGETLSLTAAGALATSCVEAGAPSDHALWQVLLEVTLTEVILSSYLLQRAVLRSLAVDVPAVGRAFARALAQGEAGAELAALGLELPGPERLAERYAELVHDPGLVALQFDAVLHLAHAHVELAEAVGASLRDGGFTEAAREALIAGYEEAYAADLTPELAEKITGWLRGNLEMLRDHPERASEALPRPVDEERERLGVCLLALRVFPPRENHLLRAIHVQSLARARLGAPTDEAPFVSRLWSEPDDAFAIEDYERFLRDRGERDRSLRVRRYRRALKARKQAARAAAAASPAPAAGEGAAPQGNCASPAAGGGSPAAQEASPDQPPPAGPPPNREAPDPDA
ncbi:MAG: hypothetical protein D6731_23740 [Planctomycetota bacterium]|nr:MAG: hypothetical protein D6731_23740 [Planctomycetota bacterium]